jgi:Domain of unknown function (DUF4271)
VKKILTTLFILVFCSISSFSQSVVDSIVPAPDTTLPKPVQKKAPIVKANRDSPAIQKSTDSLAKSPLVPFDSQFDWVTNLKRFLSEHPYFNFAGRAVSHPEIRRVWKNSDLIFYVLLGLFFYFALIKTLFSKYVNNLLAIFLRITLKQQQLREQLLQAPLPSLLLNILYFLNGGLYISLLLNYYGDTVEPNFWLQSAYCSALLVLIYSGKLIIMKSIGWIFKISKATDTYIFIVFLVNKMLGIFLLPFLVVIVFMPAQVQQVFVTLSLIFIIVLFIYRFIFSFKPIQNEIRWSLFQFFIYLCAFELAPLILIYKVLIAIVEKSN